MMKRKQIASNFFYNGVNRTIKI